jgi:hypothetical protein
MRQRERCQSLINELEKLNKRSPPARVVELNREVHELVYRAVDGPLLGAAFPICLHWNVPVPESGQSSLQDRHASPCVVAAAASGQETPAVTSPFDILARIAR